MAKKLITAHKILLIRRFPSYLKVFFQVFGIFLRPIIPPSYWFRHYILVPILVILTVSTGGFLIAEFDISSPIVIIVIMMITYTLIGAIIAQYMGRRLGVSTFLVFVFVTGFAVRVFFAFIFDANHDSIREIGLKDDLKYFEAGLTIADIIWNRGILSLIDINFISSQVDYRLVSWAFYYFNGIHALMAANMLLPIISNAMLGTISGLLMFQTTMTVVNDIQIAKWASLLWMFSPSSIAWSALNHKDIQIAVGILLIIWVVYDEKVSFMQKAVVFISTIVWLAGLRWYIAILVSGLVLQQLLIDSIRVKRTLFSKMLLAIVTFLLVVSIFMTIAPYTARAISIGGFDALVSRLQQGNELAWSATGDEFSSAAYARQISPILGWLVALFALLFTPPPTRWLGWQEFRVLGALLFYWLFAYSLFGIIYLLKSRKIHYWLIAAVAILIPTTTATFPGLVGSRHRLQVEPLFTLLAVLGMFKIEHPMKKPVVMVVTFGILIVSMAVDLLF